MRNALAFFVVFFVFVASLGPVRAQTAAPYVVGAILNLSGADSTPGLSAASGLDVAVRHLNGRGGIAGHPLQIRVLDDAGDPKHALDMLHQLVDEHDVVAIIGDVDPNVAKALDPAVQTAGIPLVSLVPPAQQAAAPTGYTRLLPRGAKPDRYGVSGWNAVMQLARDLQSHR